MGSLTAADRPVIRSLSILDFAIVERLELEFERGFTVLTGETGAGKSIVVGALSLLLGARADADLILHGKDRAEIIGSFELRGKSEALEWLRHNALDEDEQCLVRRIIYRDRASRGFVNGRPVSMQMLRELAALLVDVHGQHEHHSLVHRPAQRQILDDYAGLADPLLRLAALSREIAALVERDRQLREASAERSARQELLAHQIAELEQAAVTDEGFDALEAEQRRLSHTQDLLVGLARIAEVLYESEDGAAAQALAQCATRLSELSAFDAALADVAVLLEEAQVRVEEAARTLRSRRLGLEHDPARLAEIDSRIGVLHDLARKHRVQPDALVAVLEQLGGEMKTLQDSDAHADDTRRQLDDARRRYEALAGEISEGRAAAAQRLGQAVEAQMQSLGMAGGRFAVALTPTAEAHTGPYGRESVEFMVSANPDQPLRPLAKVASGGELSRISLALQTITAGVGRIPTLIFDEVDAGIGGRVAEIVGSLLSGLGSDRQVLCITHLPQVAAQAKHQLRVVKNTDAGGRVSVHTLDAQQRVDEIARMLGGLEITAQSRAHAAEMLARRTQ